jgi:hypothetical protein
MDSSQADIAGRRTIVANLLQMQKESEHMIWPDVLKVQIVNSTLLLGGHKAQEKH